MTPTMARLPRVLLRGDLAQLLIPTYAREDSISEELAAERMAEALKNDTLLEQIYAGVSAALAAKQAGRSEDALLDALAGALKQRIGKVGPAPRGPALSALIVRINLQLGLSPLEMWASIEGERGQALLQQGYQDLGRHLVDALLD